MTRTKNDGARIRRKSTSTAHVARGTEYIRWWYFAAGNFQMLEHEHHGRALVQRNNQKELDLHGQKKVIPLELTVIHQVRLCLLTAARLERTEVRYPFFFCDS